MKLLALDQSSRTTGYAVFEDQNLIDSGTFTLTSDNVGKRLTSYRQKVEQLIEQYDIDEVAFEDIQMQNNHINNVQTFKILAEIFGVTEEYLVSAGHSYQVISSNTWKSQLGIKGKDRATQKKNCQEWVAQNYGKKVSQDESDAIAIGACAVRQKKMNQGIFFE